MTQRTAASMIHRTGTVVLRLMLLFGAASAHRHRPATAFRTCLGNIFSGQKPATPAQAQAGARPRQHAPALDRRGRRLRPSADDGERDPRGGGEFQQLRRFDVARCRAPRYLAGQLPTLHRGAHARSAHHGPDGFAAGIHQGDLGLSRHPGERQPHRQGPRDPRQIQAAVRRGGKSLWRRPLHRRLDLGHRIQLFDPDGRPQRAEFHRDAGLHRPPPEILQGRVSGRAGNPASRRSAARTVARLLGRRVRADAVHADRVQALCGRCRRRRPPRRGRQSL